jgi:hypothetical protein
MTLSDESPPLVPLVVPDSLSDGSRRFVRGTWGTAGTRPDAKRSALSRLGAGLAEVQILSPRFSRARVGSGLALFRSVGQGFRSRVIPRAIPRSHLRRQLLGERGGQSSVWRLTRSYPPACWGIGDIGLRNFPRRDKYAANCRWVQGTPEPGQGWPGQMRSHAFPKSSQHRPELVIEFRAAGIQSIVREALNGDRSSSVGS